MAKSKTKLETAEGDPSDQRNQPAKAVLQSTSYICPACGMMHVVAPEARLKKLRCQCEQVLDLSPEA